MYKIDVVSQTQYYSYTNTYTFSIQVNNLCNLLKKNTNFYVWNPFAYTFTISVDDPNNLWGTY